MQVCFRKKESGNGRNQENLFRHRKIFLWEHLDAWFNAYGR